MRPDICRLVIAAALVTSSCATNTIRLDRATEMGAAGREATDGTGKALDTLRSTNRDVLIDLVAFDPNCALPRPRIATGRGGDGTILCRAGAPQPTDLEVRRWTARELKPSLAVIDGIAAYLGAIDAIVTLKPVDYDAEVADAEATLRGVAADLSAITGPPSIPEISDDQRNAITGTLSLLSELLDEQRRIDDLRRIERGADQEAFSRSLAALAGANESAVDRIGVQLQNQKTLIDLQLRQMARETPAVRRPVIARQLDLIDARDALPDLRRTLRASVEAFDAAHASYRDLLLGHGTLTAAERRKAAGIAQVRVVAALHNITAVIKAF